MTLCSSHPSKCAEDSKSKISIFSCEFTSLRIKNIFPHMCNLYAKSLRILRGKLGDISLEIDISTVYFFFDFKKSRFNGIIMIIS